MSRSRFRSLAGDSGTCSATALSTGRPEWVESRDHREDRLAIVVGDSGAVDDARSSSAGNVYERVSV